MGFRMRGAMWAGLALPLLTGCSTSRLTVDLMVPVLRNTTEVALRSEDPRLVGDALPTSILLLEGMLETHPRQSEVGILASMFYFAYAFGYVEAITPEFFVSPRACIFSWATIATIQRTAVSLNPRASDWCRMRT